MLERLLGWRTVVLLSVVAMAAWLALGGLPDRQLHVWFLDVGQGDAILIQTPDGQQILVDGGPSPSALLDELGEVLPFWDRSLDLIVLTHPDADHLSGLIPLLERYRIAAAVDGGEDANGNSVWSSATKAVELPIQAASRGMRFRAGNVVLTVLNPPAAGAMEAEDGNNRSVVLRLDYGETSVLLTGDAEAEAEEAMASAGVPLQADVLKVGHHGSGHSTTEGFLAEVAPELAVISVGAENRFGHPVPELLDRLHEIEVVRTDQRGRIEVVSNGEEWELRCER